MFEEELFEEELYKECLMLERAFITGENITIYNNFVINTVNYYFPSMVAHSTVSLSGYNLRIKEFPIGGIKKILEALNSNIAFLAARILENPSLTTWLSSITWP